MSDTFDRCRVALVLAGGNALGAYQAGVYEALHECGVEPAWIVGTSIGAINGAVIAGSAPDERIANLRELWRPAARQPTWPDWSALLSDRWRRTGEAMGTLLGGRSGFFGPAWSALVPGLRHDAIYDAQPLAVSLSSLVDLDRLNHGPMRFTAMAVDLDSGEDAIFDTQHHAVTIDHLRASAALPPAFPPVPIDGRMYVDGGLSANLPLDPVLAAPGETALLCIAVDLLPRSSPRPRSLGEMIGRAQDLMFGIQSRRSVERWQAAYEAGGSHAHHRVTLVRLTYADQACEVAGKAMDFSPDSVRKRWDLGLTAGRELVRRIGGGGFVDAVPGLKVASTDGV